MKVKLSLLLACSLITPIHAQVLPIDAVVDGKTIGEWSAEWWKWVFSISTNANPLFDKTGAWATNGQPAGSVFFVAGILQISGVQSRSFTVPEGKYLFFPLLDSWSDNVYTIPPLTVAELIDLNSAYVDATTELHASVDGIGLTNLWNHRALSPVFNFFYQTADNIETALAPGPVIGLNDPIVSDGYWLMLEPLSPGRHVVRFGASVGAPFNFTLDITDTITVLVPTLSEQVERLIVQVRAAGLSGHRQQELVEELKEAEKEFKRNHLDEGTEELREFQKQVRHEIASIGPALADQLIQAAQTIIDKARAQFP